MTEIRENDHFEICLVDDLNSFLLTLLKHFIIIKSYK